MAKPSEKPSWGKAARYAVYCTVILTALAVAAALILPEFLDTPAVRTAIQRIVSETVRGDVAWEELRIRTSVPVGVSGDIRDPLVVPLGPGAVTSEILGIFERTLKLPAKLINPLESGREPASPPNGK